MRWGDESDAVDSLVEDCGDLGDDLWEVVTVCWQGLTINREVSGYLVVLTIDALEIAVREEDVADTGLTADGGLLPLVDAHSGNAERSITLAITRPSL
jgi:hypothetical protein